MRADEELANAVLLPGFTGTAVPDRLARAADAGLAGVCLFAGNVDSHRALPVVADDVATLRARDLPPFAAAVEAGVRSVLTAHVLSRHSTTRPPR